MKHIWMAISLVLVLSACDGPTDNEKNKPKPTAASATDSIRNTDKIGYAGSAIADKVDSATAASADRPGQLDAELKKADPSE